MFRVVSVLAGVAALAIGLAAPASADGNIIPVRVNGSLAVVPGSFASAERSRHGVGFEVHEASLAPGTYKELWLVFNNPSACAHSNGITLCDPGVDAGNPATGFAVIPGAATFTVGPSGRANFEVRLPAAPGGLTNPRGAEFALLWKPINPSTQATHIAISDPRGHGHEDDD